jgi:hypothetical protein
MDGLVNGVRHEARPGRTGNLSGFEFIEETPKINPFTVRCNGGLPTVPRRTPRDTSVFRGSASLGRAVLWVTTSGDDAQIASPVIEAVSIPMVDCESISESKSHQFAVKTQRRVTTVHPGEPGNVSVAECPAPLTGPLSISSVDDRVVSDSPIASTQRNQCCQPIGIAGNWKTRFRTCTTETATQSSASSDVAWGSEEVNAASLTDTRDGTLIMHRTLQWSGARPSSVSSRRGLCCVNYISFLRVKAQRQPTPAEQIAEIRARRRSA